MITRSIKSSKSIKNNRVIAKRTFLSISIFNNVETCPRGRAIIDQGETIVRINQIVLTVIVDLKRK